MPLIVFHYFLLNFVLERSFTLFYVALKVLWLFACFRTKWRFSLFCAPFAGARKEIRSGFCSNYKSSFEALSFSSLICMHSRLLTNSNCLIQVQDALAQLGLVDVLDHMFDKLDWTTSHSLAKPGGIHGHGCECNPKSVSSITFQPKQSLLNFRKYVPLGDLEFDDFKFILCWQALKIQYLSLIHNFCDRDSCNKANKHLLLKSTSSAFKVLTNLHHLRSPFLCTVECCPFALHKSLEQERV